MSQARTQPKLAATLLPFATGAVAIAIFVADTITPIGVAVAVLYVAVVLMAARFCRARGVVLVAVGCIVLSIVSHLLSSAGEEAEDVANSLISIAAIGVTTLLALQSQRAEGRLREQASLLDLSHDTIFVRGMDDVITYWNQGARELYGWTTAEAVGRVTHELMQTVFPRPLEEINAELIRAGRWEGTLVHTKRDGTRLTVASRWSLQRDKQGRPALILETNNDITERTLAEQRLRASEETLRTAQADLAHVNRVATMGQLTASIAHEVNQPIAAAVINAQAGLRWLATEPPDLDEVHGALSRILESGARARDVISRIRALIKKAPSNNTSFDLNDAILDVLALTHSEAQKHGVSVRAALWPDMPPVDGDRVQLQQVVLNLIMNAIEAMSEANDAVRELQLSTEADGDSGVAFTVRDTGPGLDPQAATRLFEPFYTTKADGMGMGLPICRSIVEAHGGRLSASANEPRGAVFLLQLPRGQTADVPAARAG
jgi:PAS domain S-box-containing protein